MQFSMQLLTPTQVAGMLGVTKILLDKWRCKKTGPSYIKINSGLVRYDKSVVESFIKNRVTEVNNND